ncbi:MAG TPA: insulinase family protein [Trichormus sp.]
MLTFYSTSTTAVGAATSPPAAQALTSHAPVQSELPNGLKVTLLEDHSFPVTSCFVWYRVGARNEPPGLTGISHVVEHLLFQNAGTFQNNTIAATLARNGAQFNGFTSNDFTAFYELVHPSKLELALKIEAARMRGGTFTQNELHEETSRIISEIDGETKEPTEILSREVRATAFHEHPYRNPISGWRNDLDNISAGAAKAFYDKYYYPNNAAIFVVGDFKSEDALLMINKYFASLPKSPPLPAELHLTETPLNAERRVMMKYSGKKEVALVAYHAPAYADADAPAMVVLEKLLNIAYGGRLKTKLVDSKICSAAKSAFELKRDPGLFTVSLTASSSTPLAKVLDTWDSTIAQLRNQPITEVELHRARNQAEFALLNDRDGPYKMGFHLGFCDSMQSWQSAYNWPERFRSVTAADVERVAKRYFAAENRVVGLLSSTASTTKTPPQPGATPGPSKTPTMKAAPAAEQPQVIRTKLLQSQSFGNTRLLCYKNSDTWAPFLVAQMQNAEPDCESVLGIVAQSGSTVSAADPQSGDANQPTVPGTGSFPMAPAIPAAGVIPGITTAPSSTGPSATSSSPTGTGPSPGSGNAPAADAVYGNTNADTSTTGTATTNAAATTGTSSVAGTALSIPRNYTVPAGASAPPTMRPVSSIPLSVASMSTAVNLPIRERKLSNGMTVVVFESHLSPVIQIAGALKAGDALEPPNKKGVTEVLTSCFNSGSTKLSKAQLIGQQEDIGLPPDAMLHFQSGGDAIAFRTRCMTRDLQRQLALLNNVIRDPATSDADIEHAKQEAIGHIRYTSDTLSSKVSRAFMRNLLAPASPYYPEDPAESMKSIGTLKAADIKEFHMQTVAPEACTIVLAGDIDSDVAVRLVEQAFAGWAHSASFKNKSVPDAQPNPKRILKASIPVHDKGKNMLCLGRLLPIKRTDPRFSYLTIADCAFMNHPLFARLLQRLNQEPSLAQWLSTEEIDTKVTPMGASTAWAISMPIEPSAVLRATTLVQNELKQFSKVGITSNELSESKRYLTNALPVRQASNTEQAATTCLNAELAGAKPDSLTNEIEDIRNASLDSVNHFVRNDFRPEQATLVVAGTRESIRNVHGVGVQ